MKRVESYESIRDKQEINRLLFGIAFSLFTFIAALNPNLLKSSLFLPLQLTLAIPLLLSSIFARSRMIISSNKEKWEEYGFITFLISYTFLVNVVGILLSLLIDTTLSMAFFGINILTSLVYSGMRVGERTSTLSSRFKKDLTFIILIVLGGILPSLKFY